MKCYSRDETYCILSFEAKNKRWDTVFVTVCFIKSESVFFPTYYYALSCIPPNPADLSANDQAYKISCNALQFPAGSIIQYSHPQSQCATVPHCPSNAHLRPIAKWDNDELRNLRRRWILRGWWRRFPGISILSAPASNTRPHSTPSLSTSL